MSTAAFAMPAVATTGIDSEALLGVMLHGRGSHEGDTIALAEQAGRPDRVQPRRRTRRGLGMDDPGRYAGAAIRYGTLRSDAGAPLRPLGRRAGPMVVAQSDYDTVIRRELIERTWTHLLGESGGPTIARRHPVGHGISAGALATLGGWLRQRLAFLTTSPAWA